MIAPAARRGKKRRGERGSALVESALCFLVFMFMVLGTMEFGLMVFSYNQVSYAARDGARYAAVRGASSGHAATAATVSTYVTSNIVGLKSANVTVTTTWSPNNNPGSTVKVNVQYIYSAMALPNLIGRNVTLASAANMVISQ